MAEPLVQTPIEEKEDFIEDLKPLIMPTAEEEEGWPQRQGNIGEYVLAPSTLGCLVVSPAACRPGQQDIEAVIYLSSPMAVLGH